MSQLKQGLIESITEMIKKINNFSVLESSISNNENNY